ncbi:hypothetical protein BMS3Bbin15_00478 [archaeon BMS3Bbin15]|nr:hypothetical protein BMS3Bbin15_00478 [archaeon BMS3Bbin15]
MALVAYIIYSFYPSFDALFVALILGIIFRTFFMSEILKPGIDTSVKIFIPIGIIAYSSNLSFDTLISMLSIKIVLILFIMFTYMVVTLYLSLKYGVRRKLAILLAGGSAVCGASAIAIISPLIKAKNRDTSIAILSITAVGLTGAMIYPLFREILHISASSYAFLVGTTLPQVGIIKIASTYVGINPENALAFKSVRIAMIPIIAIFAQKLTDEKQHIKVPWFIVIFIILGILFSFFAPFERIRYIVRPISTFVFSIALASIGLSTDLTEVLEARLRVLNIAYFSWLSAFFVVVIFEKVLGMYI